MAVLARSLLRIAAIEPFKVGHLLREYARYLSVPVNGWGKKRMAGGAFVFSEVTVTSMVISNRNQYNDDCGDQDQSDTWQDGALERDCAADKHHSAFYNRVCDNRQHDCFSGDFHSECTGIA